MLQLLMVHSLMKAVDEPTLSVELRLKNLHTLTNIDMSEDDLCRFI